MHSRALLAVLGTVALCGCPALKPRQPPLAAGEVEQRCSRVELRRVADASVRELLGEKDAAVRARAALALGRVHDGASVEPLGQLLLDGAMGDVAAWALGRLDGGEAPLMQCLSASCPSSAAAARALGAPGRSDAAIELLTKALAGDAVLAAAAATSLGLIARLGGKREKSSVADVASSQLLLALARPEPAVRLGAAMALGRLPPREAPPALPAAILAALADPSPEVRAHAAGAAARLGAPPAALAPLLRDADWRVRVEGARALAVIPGAAPVLAAALPEAIRDADVDAPPAAKWAHALAALLEASAKSGGVARAGVPSPGLLRASTAAATATVRCAAAMARDRATGWVEETKTCGEGIEPEWRGRLRAGILAVELGEKEGSPARPAALAALTDGDPRVRAQAAAAAGPAFAEALARLLEDNDPYVVAEAAGALAKDPAAARGALDYATRALQRFKKDDVAPAGAASIDALVALAQLGAAAKKAEPPPLPDDFLKLLSGLAPSSAPLHHALAEALKAMGGPALGAAPPPSVPAEAESGLPGNGPRLTRLRLSTSAGELVVALHAGDGEAPLTSAAVASLASRKFYDGLSWHRVVPDFVIQGGDPRGDGDGGPGWALPDEHSPLRFRRGTLGIATSGAETGGSQIFLCHSAQPHLDGRYTIAGELAEGEETLDAIHVGDTVLSAQAE